MGKKNRQRDEAWAHAKKVCRLSARQVDMAKKLGMNPRTLPGLRPSPSQRWKLPVGEFIEECYAKRFKEEPVVGRRGEPQRTPAERPAREDTLVSEKDPFEFDEHSAAEPEASSPPQGGRPQNDEAGARRWDLAGDLVVHLANLQLDLERELVAGWVEPETLARIAADLRRVAEEIETGKGISQMPYDVFELGLDNAGDYDEVPF